MERTRYAVFIADATSDIQALLTKLPCFCIVSLSPSQICEIMQGNSNIQRIALFT